PRVAARRCPVRAAAGPRGSVDTATRGGSLAPGFRHGREVIPPPAAPAEPDRWGPGAALGPPRGGGPGGGSNGRAGSGSAAFEPRRPPLGACRPGFTGVPAVPGRLERLADLGGVLVAGAVVVEHHLQMLEGQRGE